MKNVLVLSLSLLMVVNVSYGQFKKKKSTKKDKIELDLDGDKEKDKDKGYEELLKDAETFEGFFKIHVKKEKYYFEIPNEMLGKDMLLTSRVSKISDNRDVLAGQMPKKPMLVKWSKSEKKVHIHELNPKNICDKDDAIYDSFMKNNMEPIMKSFKIETHNLDSTATVIDVTDLFATDEKALNPFLAPSILDAIFGVSKMKGTFKKDNSRILEAKAFSKNINIRSLLSYTVQDAAFSAELVRNIILLPETPMQPRLGDDRVGYFETYKDVYNSSIDKVERETYIHRWNMQPKDWDAYNRGELVEPVKPIVYYVDNSFPEKWKKYIKLGIEDWQKAFEAIGFKNAIVAKDYPKDPSFDPDDFNNSCFRYIATDQANAMGPSQVDPRSGEIICGNVFFYHNVIALLHNWRFVQTATVDPRVRKDVFDEDVMGESIRYVAAHEIGHTLGLLHNFWSSYSYPVESLRDKAFTEKYGTTPSIMDYARNNYVAQPGDEAKLTPPLLGVYDYHAIKWGYKPIKTDDFREEKKTLDKWILEAQKDPMLIYGEQQWPHVIDPTCQSEALGDDAVKAGDYGIKNLKIIMDNLEAWTTSEGEDYEDLTIMYQEVFRQFHRYIVHVKEFVGGVRKQNIVQGENKSTAEFISEAKQKECVNWLFDQIKDMPNWMLNEDVISKMTYKNGIVADYQNMLITSLVSPGTLAHLANFEKRDPKNAYTQREYLNDLTHNVFVKTKSNKRLDYYDRSMQYAYIKALVLMGDYKQADKKTKKLAYWEDNSAICSCDYHLIGAKKEADVWINTKPLFYGQLKVIKALLQKGKNNASNLDDREHYEHLLVDVTKMLEE